MDIANPPHSSFVENCGRPFTAFGVRPAAVWLAQLCRCGWILFSDRVKPPFDSAKKASVAREFLYFGGSCWRWRRDVIRLRARLVRVCKAWIINWVGCSGARRARPRRFVRSTWNGAGCCAHEVRSSYVRFLSRTEPLCWNFGFETARRWIGANHLIGVGGRQATRSGQAAGDCRSSSGKEGSGVSRGQICLYQRVNWAPTGRPGCRQGRDRGWDAPWRHPVLHTGSPLRALRWAPDLLSSADPAPGAARRQCAR
jgi:hypothetical protein